MNIPNETISRQSKRVQFFFRQWMAYMEHDVEFWKIPGDYDIHTQSHCERVLMHSLRIGDARKDNDRTMTALAFASIFHDTRRKDNYLDTGHGARAAEYYKEYCSAHNIEYMPETYAAIWYHDRDDEMGEKYIREHTKTAEENNSWLEIYHIFKDADALDRLRLGTWCLDPKFLRTPEAKAMIPFAQYLVEATTNHDDLMKTYKELEKFKPTH